VRDQLTLPPTTASVGVARRFLHDALLAWGGEDLAWVGAQVLSELATNAVIHAGTPFTVSVEYDTGVLRLRVGDGSTRAPRQRHYGRSATTGRGVALVATLSRTWGVTTAADGKVVWCEMVAAAPDADVEPDLDAFLDAEDRAELGGFPDGAGHTGPASPTARGARPVAA
jgi:anti-sigma regulatory factor (Ser/Thr protein kinase)